MLGSLLLLSIFSSISLFASNLTFSGRIVVYAKTQMKTTYVDTQIIKEAIYLKTNHSGFTIALSEDSDITSVMVNKIPLSLSPISLSDTVHLKSTQVGELVVSQKENHGTLAVTISAK